jgi:hypothetical protein
MRKGPVRVLAPQLDQDDSGIEHDSIARQDFDREVLRGQLLHALDQIRSAAPVTVEAGGIVGIATLMTSTSRRVLTSSVRH